MMFWIGLVIAFLGGVLSIPLISKKIKRMFPRIKDNSLDKIVFATVTVGLMISSIEHIQSEIENEELKSRISGREYEDIAKYNIYGNVSAKVMGVPIVKSPIQDWGKEFVINIGDTLFDCKCTDSAMKKYAEVNEILPLYPFTYYFLAKCYKEHNDARWIIKAKKAKEILKGINNISAKQKDHLIVLTQVDELLNENITK